MAGDVKKSVEIAINIVNGVGKQVGSIVTSFGKLTDSVNKATKAVGNLSTKLGKLKTPSNIKSLGTDLQSISKVDGKGINTLATGLGKLDKIKFPKFKTVNADLAQHAKRLKDVIKAYNDLSTASKGVNLKGLTTGIKNGSTNMKNLSKNTKQSGTSFSQWGFALGSASTGLSKFGTQLYGVTRGFSAVSKELSASMLIFTGAFVGMFALKGVITDLVKFDDAIRAAGAVAGASSVELDQFADAARDMGENTRYTATEAAEALKALAMTGLSVTESMDTLPTVLNLAAAANMDLGESADIVTNIMVGYQKTVSDLPHIADLMTAAFTSSNTSLKEVGIALKYVGPVARSAGIELEETTGIIASLANAGYRGSKAGTAFRTSIARILAPTEKMRKVLAKYKISMDQLVNEDGTMKSFTGMLDIMRTKSVTTGDALILFGKRAGPGMLSLMGQSADAIDQMNQKIAESEGIALKTAHEMESGLGGSLRRLKSMWEEVSLAIGEVIQDDAKDFIESLTKTLKDNKDQIAEVATELFNFIGGIAKVVGWMASFVASNLKVIAGLSALALAVRFISKESKILLGVNILGMFTDLSRNVKWRSMSMGITKVSTALNLYTSSVKSASAASASSALPTLMGTLSGGSMANAGKNVTTLGASLVKLAKSAAAASYAFMVANPWLVAIVIAVAAMHTGAQILNKDYDQMAKNAMDSAKATGELNKNIKYQVAELNLLSSAYDNNKTGDYSSEQERLTTAVMDSSIPLSEKIDLLINAKKGSEEFKEALVKLREEQEKHLEEGQDEEIKKVIEARKLKAQAIAAEEKAIKKLYGVIINPKAEKQVRTMSDDWEDWNDKISVTGYVTKAVNSAFGTSLEDRIKKVQKLTGEQGKYNNTYGKLIKKMTDSGKSTDEVVNKLIALGATKEDINDLTPSIEKLTKNIKESGDASGKAGEEARIMAEKEKAAADEILLKWKQTSKDKTEILKNANLEILIMEANGIISHDQAEKAKLQLAVDVSQQRVALARQQWNDISDIEEEGKAKARLIMEAEEAKAASARQAQLSKVVSEEQSNNKKLIDSSKKLLDAKEKHREKIVKIAKDLFDKNEKLAEDTADKETKINEDLAKNIEKIREDLQKKTKKFAEDRIKIAKSASDAIKGIELSTEDKIRAIRQRSMSDSEIAADNEEAAIKKLAQGRRLVAQAAREGDAEKLERGKKLIQQSGDLYAEHENEEQAINGVQDAANALKDAELANAKIAISARKKVQAENKRIAKEEIADNKADSAEEIKAILEAAKKQRIENQKTSDAALAEESRLNDIKIKSLKSDITLLEQKQILIANEKSLILENVEAYKQVAEAQKESGGNYDEAIASAQQAVDTTREFGQSLDEVNNKNIEVSFQSDGISVEEKTDKIREKIIQLEDGTYVNIKLIGEDKKPIEESIGATKEKIEGMDVAIDIKAGVEDIEKAIELIEEIKAMGVSIVIRVEDQELTKTSTTLKALVKLIKGGIALNITVNGYDKLFKAKSLMDKFKSKEIILTTRHRNIPAPTNKAEGGEIQQYATGGNVFSRLRNRFIGSGGGKKDDVPAMLMKGEFVQKVSAVKKYGKDFMARLNAGLIPRSISNAYANGGDVQPEQYASGGHVGFGSSMRRMKKKYEEELIGKRSDISGTMNLNVNNKLSKMDVLSESGISAISSLKSVIGDSISAFATGGSTIGSESVRSLSANLNSEYNNKIAAAKRIGDTALADILKKEQTDLKNLSTELTKDLKELEDEYKEFKTETTKEHDDRVSEITSTYNDNDAAIDGEHSKVISDLEKDFLERISSVDETQLDSDDEYKDAIEQYKKDKETIAEELKDSEMSNAIAHRNATSVGHSLGEQISGLIGNKNAREYRDQRNGLLTMDQITGHYAELKKGPYKSSGAPDFDFMRKMLGDAFPELKNLLSGNYEDFLDDASKTSRIAVSSKLAGGSKRLTDEEFKAGEHETYKSGISVSYADTDYAIGLATQIGEIEKAFNSSDISAHKKIFDDRLADVVKQENETKSDYQKESLKNSTDKKEYTTEYSSSANDENSEYNSKKSEYSKTYKDDLKDEGDSYVKTMADREKSYKKTTSDMRESFNSSSTTIKQATKDEAGQLKDSTSTEVGAIKLALDDELKKLGTSSNSSYATASSTSNISIKDLLKRLGVPGYNTGGLVNPTGSSIPGKDSILANLTPNEYVMKAPVVSKFGKGFFDALNNFKIPHFNTGGIVGSIGSTLLSGGDSAEESVRHILDLSINGSGQGELTGSSMTIEKILNDLTLAKMRA